MTEESNAKRRASAAVRRSGWRHLHLGSRRELITLVLLLLVSAGVWGFVALAGEVGEGDTRALDTRILLAMRNPQDRADPLGPGWVEELGRDFTALGGIGVLSLVSLATIGYLLLDGKRRAALLVFVAVGGGLLISNC